MKRGTTGILIALLLPVFLVGCRKEEPQRRNLVFVGSRSHILLVRRIARQFEDQHPEVRIDVEPVGSARAIVQVRQGLADLGILGRPLRPDEFTLTSVPVAREGMAFIVHRDNQITALNRSQIAGLFSRTLTNWKDVGGSNTPVVVVGQPENWAGREVILDYLGLTTQQFKPNPSAGSSEQLVQAVAERRGAIGYASLAAALENRHVRCLPLEGIAPTMESVNRGRYPLTRPVLLISRARPTGDLADFISFARSNQVHDLIRRHGLIPAVP